MPVRNLSPSRVADQHPKRYATQICPRGRGGSVWQRCWRHKLTGLEQCMTMDRQACSLRQHETAGEGYEMLATPRVSTSLRAHFKVENNSFELTRIFKESFIDRERENKV